MAQTFSKGNFLNGNCIIKSVLLNYMHGIHAWHEYTCYELYLLDEIKIAYSRWNRQQRDNHHVGRDSNE
jgi:hypothetical protein